MFAKKVSQLVLVGMRRYPSFSPSNFNRGILGLVGNFNNQNINVKINCFLSTLPSPVLTSNSVSCFPVASLPCHSVRSMSSKESPRMGSIMEHAKYKEMYELLMKDSNLSPLNIVCLYIISQKTSMQRDNCKVATSHNQHDAFILYTTIYNFSSSEMRFISRTL